MHSAHYTTPATVKVEVPSALLATLIQQGLLRGNECKCLDANAKQVVWQSLLANAIDYSEL